MNTPRHEAGFSLLEILVAVMVFGLLTTSVFYFLGQQNSMSTRATDSEKSLTLAKLVIDSLKVTPYDSLRAGSDTVSERYLRSWHVSINRDGMGQPKGNKQVDVTISWPLNGASNLSMATLVSDEKFKDTAGGP